MTTPLSAAVNWHAWFERWERVQTNYLPTREEHFTAMLDVLDVLLPAECVVLDLACGPGTVSQRILARFPQARCIAVDLDPVLLALGQAVLGTMEHRLRWVEADLRTPAWTALLEVEQVDAVVSAAALHYLNVQQLAPLYHQLAELVHPDGVVLNADHLQWGPHMPQFRRVADSIQQRERSDAFQRRGEEDWQQWWTALAHEPALQALFAERTRRLKGQLDMEQPASTDMHLALLRDAGFREVGLIWQKMGNGIIMAVR
jgi:SAM-dependent methyltransferase